MICTQPQIRVDYFLSQKEKKTNFAIREKIIVANKIELYGNGPVSTCICVNRVSLVMVSAGNVHGFLRAYAIRRTVPVQANDSDTPNCFSPQYSQPVQTMGTRFALRPALGVDASLVKLSLI
jgi:hypothetical protein